MATQRARSRQPIDATIELPGSKSYTNRALLVAALAEGSSVISGALVSDDTRAMLAALRALGIDVQADETATSLAVHGRAAGPATSAVLDTANAGTAARFLTAAVALGHGHFTIDGSARMRQRPIQPLLDGLQQLGVRAVARFGNGCPPVDIVADGLPAGTVRMRGDLSSQYFSALLLAAPCAQGDLDVQVEGELVSAPYLDLTAGTMADFGVQMQNDGYRRFRVTAGQRYRGRAYTVEPDASAASYFFAAAAVTGGRVRIERLPSTSVQGDLGLLEVLEEMGCRVSRSETAIEVEGPVQLRGVSADFTRMGDVASTLAAIAPFASEPVTLTGIAQTHFEESDRPVAVATELQRMGIQVESTWDSLRIYPGVPRPCVVQTYDDHRIGDELRHHRAADAGSGDREPRVRGQDVPPVLRGPPPGDARGLMPASSAGGVRYNGRRHDVNCSISGKRLRTPADQWTRRRLGLGADVLQDLHRGNRRRSDHRVHVGGRRGHAVVRRHRADHGSDGRRAAWFGGPAARRPRIGPSVDVRAHRAEHRHR